MEKQREFKFTQKDFDTIRTMVHKRTGINLSDAKKDMVYSRLARRVRQLGLNSFEEYTKLLDSDSDTEIVNFTNAITTNLTSFFREPHHFHYLGNTIIPHLLKVNAPYRRMRIWSAGCSTGEEPYTLAMTLRQYMPKIDNWDVKILATDLDSNVLDTAREGVYPEARVSALEKSVVKKWFVKGRGENAGQVRVVPELQELITFKQLNLMESWPMKGPFDLIICRNVVIYFDKPTQKILFERYADMLRDQGHLIIGHSETLFKVTERFTLLGQTIYQKKY